MQGVTNHTQLSVTCQGEHDPWAMHHSLSSSRLGDILDVWRTLEVTPGSWLLCLWPDSSQTESHHVAPEKAVLVNLSVCIPGLSNRSIRALPTEELYTNKLVHFGVTIGSSGVLIPLAAHQNLGHFFTPQRLVSMPGSVTDPTQGVNGSAVVDSLVLDHAHSLQLRRSVPSSEEEKKGNC